MPRPFPTGRTSAQISAYATPRGAYVPPLPAQQGRIIIIDDIRGPNIKELMDRAKAPPSWIKPIGTAKGPHTFIPILGKSMWGYSAYKGLKYSWEQGWGPLLSYLNPMVPFGAMRVQGWHTSCSTPFCGNPWSIGWSGSGSAVCTVLCSTPTSTINKSLVEAAPWGWDGLDVNGLKCMNIQSATSTLYYYRVKQIWFPNAGLDWLHKYQRVNRLKPDPGLLENPFQDPSNFFQPGTTPLVNLVPDLAPVNQPGPLPAPWPYYLVRPYELPGVDPLNQARKWPSPAGLPRPRPEQAYSPVPGIGVFPNPGAEPDIIIDVSPNASVRSMLEGVGGYRGLRHRQAPPGKKTTERKPKNTKLYNAAKALVNAVTETADVVDAAWNALDAHHPKGSTLNGANGWQTRKRGVQTSYPQKVKDIYNAFKDPKFNETDFARDFAVGLAKNEAGDRAGGAIGKRTKAANKAGAGRKGINLGVASGPAL